jgi:hypothetical protein
MPQPRHHDGGTTRRRRRRTTGSRDEQVGVDGPMRTPHSAHDAAGTDTADRTRRAQARTTAAARSTTTETPRRAAVGVAAAVRASGAPAGA